jgi:HK97 gp10 family phage protein
MGVKVLGLDAVKGNLAEFRKNTVRKYLRESMRISMKEMFDAVKDHAPDVSGNMIRKLKLRAIKRSRKNFGVAVTLSAADVQKFYATFVEWGTKRMQGEHYMKDAFEATAQAVVDHIIELVSERVGK